MIQNKIFLIFTKTDRLKNSKERQSLHDLNKRADENFNKKFFNTSIKEVNTIILLKKFLMDSL